MDRADWEAPEISGPCTQAVTGRDDGVVAEARLVAFDQNTRSCKEAVNWTSEGIMLSRVPLLYQRRSGLHTGRRDVVPVSERHGQPTYSERDSGLGAGAPDSAAYVHGIQHGPDMACVPATPHDLTVDLEIVEMSPMDMVLTDDLTVRLASPLFYEKGCIATWGFCTLPTCCEPKVECVRKNYITLNVATVEGYPGRLTDPLQNPCSDPSSDFLDATRCRLNGELHHCGHHRHFHHGLAGHTLLRDPSWTKTSTIWITHGGRSRRPKEPDSLVSRVNGLSTLSKLHGVDKRTESHRDQIIAVNNKITSIMAGDAAQNQVHAMVGQHPTGRGEVFPGTPRSPSSDGRCVLCTVYGWTNLAMATTLGACSLGVRRVCSSRARMV
jgi:hypothetical protein